MVTESGELVVRVAGKQAQANEWMVVLHAAGVPCRVDTSGPEWLVVVAATDGVRAQEALGAYEVEVSDVFAVNDWGSTRAGLVMAAVLLAAYPFTGFRGAARSLFVAGEANAALILNGQPWRAVTALMLHADATHLVGNVVAMVVFATAVCGQIGPGLGAALIVLGGVTGNILNALLRGAPHVSIGASTAVFAAVGVLAGLAIVRTRPSRRRWWVPFAAGLALLGLLGTGEHADLAAHFFGFHCGLALGIAAAVLLDRPLAARAQWWLGGTTVAVVTGAWLLAAATIARR